MIEWKNIAIAMCLAGSLIISGSVGAVPLEPLLVEKTAETSFDREWTWTIDKTTDETELTLAEGQIYTVDYNVDMDATATDSNWMVSGVITITNPNPIEVQVLGIDDNANGSIATLTDCESTFLLSAGESIDCAYEAILSGAVDGTNVATVTAFDETGTFDVGNTASADYSFFAPTTETDECVDVSDTQFGGGNPFVTVCADGRIFYSINLMYEDPGLYYFMNTASFITNDTGVTGSDGHVITVTVTAVPEPTTLALLSLGFVGLGFTRRWMKA